MVCSFTLQEAEKQAEEERIRMENIIKGNPLLNQEKMMAVTEFKVKRRYVSGNPSDPCFELDVTGLLFYMDERLGSS